MRPIAISCGEPAGIGPEIAAKAWQALGSEIPLVWLGDPRHLPAGTPIHEADDPAAQKPGKLTVLARDFGAPAVAGHPDPTHAQGVIDGWQ